jgi:hypothetical protein
MKSTDLRKLIRESVEEAVSVLKFQEDMPFLGKYKLDETRMINGAKTWRFEFSTDDNSYRSKVFLVGYPDGSFKMKLDVYWKTSTKDNTAGAGKDFTRTYGPYLSYEEMAKELNRVMTNNPLIGTHLYFDNNEKMFDREICRMLTVLKEKIGEVRELNHPSLRVLEKVYDAIKDIPEDELEKFCDENFRGWLQKQGLIYKLQSLDKIPYYKSLRAHRS